MPLFPCQWLRCPPSDTADTSVSPTNRSCLRVSIFHRFSCDRDRITSLQTSGKPLFPWKPPKFSPICHVAMKNRCDFFPEWRDWPAEEWVCRRYRVCVSLHVLLGLFACNLIRALQFNWKIDLVMLLYTISVCPALSRMMTHTCSLCTLFLLSCYTCRNQEAATIPPSFFCTFFKIHVIILKKTTKNVNLSTDVF